MAEVPQLQSFDGQTAGFPEQIHLKNRARTCHRLLRDSPRRRLAEGAGTEHQFVSPAAQFTMTVIGVGSDSATGS